KLLWLKKQPLITKLAASGLARNPPLKNKKNEKFQEWGQPQFMTKNFGGNKFMQNRVALGGIVPQKNLLDVI
ncbi:MAG: hypothetical protein AAB723_02940, partial [Patescibacteria group bacterium]